MLVNLNEVLCPAKKGGYAVGLFNTVSLELAKGVFEAAENMKSPIIVGTAEVFLNYSSLNEVADILIPMAKRASVPVVVHYDHGLTFEKCMEALKLGFTSVMYDCSTDSYEENIRKVAELVRIAHAFGATVEGELGHVGNAEDDTPSDNPSEYFTKPGQAAEYIKMTGVDALAIAVGTAHGAYRFTPKLDFGRIEEIAGLIPVPLVLHGGSGLSDEDFKHAIAQGISKVNIFTDLNLGAVKGIKEAISEGKKGIIDLIPYQISAVRTAAMEKIALFGSAGKG